MFDIAERYAVVYEKIRNKRREDEGDFDFAEREEDMLSQRIVKMSFKPLRQGVRRFSFIDVQSLYVQLFDDEAAIKRRRMRPRSPFYGLKFVGKPKKSWTGSNYSMRMRLRICI